MMLWSGSSIFAQVEQQRAHNRQAALAERIYRENAARLGDRTMRGINAIRLEPRNCDGCGAPKVGRCEYCGRGS